MTDSKPNYVSTSREAEDQLISSSKLLLVTATPTETQALHDKLEALPGELGVVRIFRGNHTYFIAKFGRYQIAHFQCDMGSIGRGSATIAVTDSIALFDPVGALMIGIAFGSDEESQSIGDVLISDYVIPYDSKREGLEKRVSRSPHLVPGVVLANRFRNSDLKREDFKVSTVPLLTGESLVDNIAYRKELLSDHPQAKGGEMEGVGLAAAANAKKLEWLLVKAICDYADGNKGKNKKEFQTKAANNAVIYCLEVLSRPGVLDDLGCLPVHHEALDQAKKKALSDPMNTVLFDVFESNLEEYFWVREIDEDVAKWASHFDVWICGKSGLGKTSILMRASLRSSEHQYIALGTFADSPTQNALAYLASEILNQPDNFAPWSKISKVELIRILSELQVVCQPKGCIYIDEIPRFSDSEFSEFCRAMVELISIIKKKSPDLKRVFYSSILNPQKSLTKESARVFERLKLVEIGSWSQEDSIGLITKIENFLNLDFHIDQRATIYTSSKGSPRFIKMFFMNYLMFEDLDQTQRFARSLKITETEFIS